MEQLCVNFLKSKHILKTVFTSEIHYLYWKNSIGCLKVDWLTFRQDKHKLHVLDSPSPLFQNLLNPSLPVHGAGGGGGGGAVSRSYADAITKCSHIDVIKLLVDY